MRGWARLLITAVITVITANYLPFLLFRSNGQLLGAVMLAVTLVCTTPTYVVYDSTVSYVQIQ